MNYGSEQSTQLSNNYKCYLT